MTVANAGTVICPSCQRAYETSEKRAGRSTKCWCGQTITFPRVMDVAPVNSAVHEFEQDDANDLGPQVAPKTAGTWFWRYIGTAIASLPLNIVLAPFGVRMRPQTSMQGMPSREKWKAMSMIWTPVVTFILLLILKIQNDFRVGSLNSHELLICLGTVVVGAILAMIVAGKIPYVGFVCPFLVAGASYLAYQHVMDARQQMTAALQGHLTEYLDVMPAGTAPAGRQLALSGKFVVIDRATHRIDDLQFLLPESIQAARPSDVKTVVWVDWSEKVEGVYGGHGGKAIQRVADLTFVDLSGRTPVAYTKRFIGEPPAMGKYSDKYGPFPYADIVDYIQGSGN